jgi:hypothetical protein
VPNKNEQNKVIVKKQVLIKWSTKVHNMSW